jgi:hypothetical protein
VIAGKFTSSFASVVQNVDQGIQVMEYEERFTDAELGQVIEQAMIYMCACPAQVADAVRKPRELYRYQLRCIADPGNNSAVHSLIAQTTIHSHAIMQERLEKVIELEEWDRSTLEMPAGLRKRQLQEILADQDGK